MADRFKTQLNAIQIAVNQDDFGPQATVVVDSSSGGVIAAVGALELQRTSPKLEEIHSVSGLKAGVASSLDLVVPSSGSALQNYSDFGFTSYTGAIGYAGYLGGFRSLWDAAMLLDTEAQAAKARDDVEEARAIAAEAVNAGLISTEEARALAAEAVNAGLISTEEARALAAEAVNAGLISTETSRAMAVEAVNATDIATNVTDIAAETARALAAEAVNAAAIAAEVVDRQSAISSALASEMSYMGGVDVSGVFPVTSAAKGDMYTVTVGGFAPSAAGVNFFSIVLEPGDVIIAESVLGASMTEADWTVIQKNLTDVATNTNLLAEVARATAAEAVNAANIAINVTDIAAEEVRALAGEAVNFNLISTEVSRAMGAEAVNAGLISTEEARAIAAEAINAGLISTEVSRAMGAEAVNAGLISTEEARALAAEAVNAGLISAEEARALAAEASLQEFGSQYGIRENLSAAVSYGNVGLQWYDATSSQSSGEPDEYYSSHWWKRQEATAALVAAGSGGEIEMRLQETSKHSLSLNGLELMPALFQGLVYLHDESSNALTSIDPSTGALITTVLDTLFDTTYPLADYILTTTGDVWFRAGLRDEDAIKLMF
jgi:polyhydroxyalkanoate synthesis regulator phasin